MPNHVTSRIEFHGDQERINEVLELINGENGRIDFDKIIQMPDNIFRGNLGQEERELYGKNNWYDWSCSHWGTKWNAYGISFDSENNIIEFNTAWSCPLPVLDRLAEMCYEYGVSFTGKWADEDCGCNVGVFESDCDGDEYWFGCECIEDCSSEAYEIYIDLKGESECIGRDAEGNWTHYDCDTCPNAGNC